MARPLTLLVSCGTTLLLAGVAAGQNACPPGTTVSDYCTPAAPPAAVPSPVGTRLSGDNSSNHLSGGAGNDTISGHGQADTLAGGAGDDVIHGGAGNDRIVGGPGRDTVYGGPGDDHVSVRDGDIDIVYCGAGNDTVTADLADHVAPSCEHVLRAGSRRGR
jgi:Ca2+-binding RTX toxin-like protein